MKKGVGDDPFADVSADQAENESEEPAGDERTGGDSEPSEKSDLGAPKGDSDRGRAEEGSRSRTAESSGGGTAAGRGHPAAESKGTGGNEESARVVADDGAETRSVGGVGKGGGMGSDGEGASNDATTTNDSTTMNDATTTNDSTSVNDAVTGNDAGSSSASAAASVSELPYLARRQLKNGSVKADRDQVPFFLRTEVQRGERDLRRAVEDELGQEINKTDLREAAYVFAQEHPEGVAAVLRDWGIEYLD